MRTMALLLAVLSVVAATAGCEPTVSGQTLNELADDKDIVFINQSWDGIRSNDVFPANGPGNALYDEIQRLKAAMKAKQEGQQSSNK